MEKTDSYTFKAPIGEIDVERILAEALEDNCWVVRIHTPLSIDACCTQAGREVGPPYTFVHAQGPDPRVAINVVVRTALLEGRAWRVKFVRKARLGLTRPAVYADGRCRILSGPSWVLWGGESTPEQDVRVLEGYLRKKVEVRVSRILSSGG